MFLCNWTNDACAQTQVGGAIRLSYDASAFERFSAPSHTTHADENDVDRAGRRHVGVRFHLQHRRSVLA
jgi:hypothetical protein